MSMRVVVVVVVVLSLAACPAAGPALTDAQVTKYIAAYKNLKAAGPGLAEQARQGAGPQGQAAFDKAIRDAGFASYPEFVAVNAKIAFAFSNGQATSALQKTDADVSDADKQLLKAIADPNVPEATRVELRKSLETIRAGYANNKKFADVAMTVSDTLTNKDDLAVVMRHRAELEAVFRSR
ncbi:MAG: hypothetical protein Q8O67_12890 [Deltaproteobacteria bacterium]|nr:hypothetical protein [Deltaproteobacteria bacterium]